MHLSKAHRKPKGTPWELSTGWQNKKRPAGVVAGGTLRHRVVTALEGYSQRVLKFSISVRLRSYGTYLGIRRTVLDRNSIRQDGRRISTCVHKLGTRGGVRSVEAYVVVYAIYWAAWISPLRVVKQIEGIHPELHLNPFGYMEVLGHREVHGAGGRPQAVADRRIPNRAQLEPVHGVTVRVDPLEIVEARVPARLSRHQVRPLSVRTVADAGGVIHIRHASDDGRQGVSTRNVDDGA